MHYQLPPSKYSLISSFKLEIETPSTLGPNCGNSEKLLYTTSFPGISGLSGGLCIASAQGPWVDSVKAGLCSFGASCHVALKCERTHPTSQCVSQASLMRAPDSY